MLEISRALVMKPCVLVDEPSIDLEPKYIEMVFEIWNLQKNEKNNYFS